VRLLTNFQPLFITVANHRYPPSPRGFVHRRLRRPTPSAMERYRPGSIFVERRIELDKV